MAMAPQQHDIPVCRTPAQSLLEKFFQGSGIGSVRLGKQLRGVASDRPKHTLAAAVVRLDGKVRMCQVDRCKNLSKIIFRNGIDLRIVWSVGHHINEDRPWFFSRSSRHPRLHEQPWGKRNDRTPDPRKLRGIQLGVYCTTDDNG